MAAQFCRCGHNRSLTWVDPVEHRRHPNVCSVPKCECVKHDTATTPKKAKLALVEPSPNAMARDAAVALVGAAKLSIRAGSLAAALTDIDAALVCLGAIS